MLLAHLGHKPYCCRCDIILKNNVGDDINIVPTFVLTPLVYLGGTFYSIESLPQIWQDFSSINPIAYIVSSYRYGFLGIEEINIFLALVIVLVFAVFLFIIGIQILNKGVGIKN